MTEEQALQLLNKADVTIAKLESLMELLQLNFNNIAIGIRFIMYGVGLLMLCVVIKFLWVLFAKWFFGGV